MKEIITKLAAVPKPNEIQGQSSDIAGNVITILNVFIGVLSAVAVVVIVIGGINYMTSAGDAAKVKKAKDTILYAVIGLIVCALAAVIVNFVVKTALAGV